MTVTPADPWRETPETRRDFIYIAAATAAVGAVGAAIWPLIDQMEPSADTLALAVVEFDYGKVALGQQIVVTWQGRPVFIRHRTPKEIAEAVGGGREEAPPTVSPVACLRSIKAGAWGPF